MFDAVPTVGKGASSSILAVLGGKYKDEHSYLARVRTKRGRFTDPSLNVLELASASAPGIAHNQGKAFDENKMR